MKKSFILLVFFSILILFSFGCSDSTTDPTTPENDFYSFDLGEGDVLKYQSHNHGLTIEGPDTVHWNWVDGRFFMGNDLATVMVRPLIPAPNEGLTEEMITLARSIYTDVPFIDDLLEGNPDPTNEEWGEAYSAWLDAISELTNGIIEQFFNDEREDRLLVLAELVEVLNNHDLVVPDSANYFPNEETSNGRYSILVTFKGLPHEIYILVGQEPVPAMPISISKEDAAWLHHFVQSLYDLSSVPVTVDLSTGIMFTNRENN